MFGGVPEGVVLEENEGPEDLLFFEVPRGSFWDPFGVQNCSKINKSYKYFDEFQKIIRKS